MVSPGLGPFEPRLENVRVWADEQGIADETLAELDLRLTHAIGLIATSDLGELLSFKGGTALNKLYFGSTARLSVDLDFNALGDERTVYRRCREVRESLIAVLEQSGALKQRHDYGVAGDRILFRYPAVSTGDTRTYKVEISLTERFAVCGTVRRPLRVPLTARPLDRVEITVNTVALVELIATKIRALHQRRKGRDVFDIWQAIHRVEDTTLLRKLVLFYFACRGVSFDRRVFFETLGQKLRDRRFHDDLRVFLRPDTTFDWTVDTEEARQWLEEVFALDEADQDFILLSKHLIGTALGRKAAAVEELVTHPLVFLLGDRPELSREARQFTTADLQRLMRGTPPDANAGV